MRKHLSLACALAVASSLLITSPASAAPNINTEPLRDGVTVNGIRQHLTELQAIADANEFEGVPTRATGTPGHEASVEYVVERMEAAGFNVSLQQSSVNGTGKGGSKKAKEWKGHHRVR